MSPFAAKWITENRAECLSGKLSQSRCGVWLPAGLLRKLSKVIEENVAANVTAPEMRSLMPPLCCASRSLSSPSCRLRDTAKGKPKREQEISSYVLWCPLCACMSEPQLQVQARQANSSFWSRALRLIWEALLPSRMSPSFWPSSIMSIVVACQ